jgi:hypothetical protein
MLEKKNGDYPASASALASWIKGKPIKLQSMSAVSTHDTNMLLLLLLPPKKKKKKIGTVWRSRPLLLTEELLVKGRQKPRK